MSSENNIITDAGVRENSSDLMLKIENVSKCFELYNNPADRLRQMFHPRKKLYKEFWALQNINFELHRGECIGIIGRNGAGKSTLLQIITGTLGATTGTVERNGKIAALLELGSGFDPEFTGRQNVFFNASILGMSEEKTAEKFQDIVDFADIGDFLDQPVKTYSSGMMARLAFAVNAFVDADLLIVDEILSVGDALFQQKCNLHLKRLLEKGTSLLFVSHSTGAVQQLCSKALYLDHGKMVTFSDSATAISMYLKDLSLTSSNKTSGTKENIPAKSADDSAKTKTEPVEKKTVVPVEEEKKEPPKKIFYEIYEAGKNISIPLSPVNEAVYEKKNQGERYGSMRAKIIGVDIFDAQGKPRECFMTGETMVFRMHVKSDHDINRVCYNLKILTEYGVGVVHFSSYERGQKELMLKAGETVSIDFVIPCVLGGKRKYQVLASLTTLEDGSTMMGEHEVLDAIQSCNVFEVRNTEGYDIWDLIDIPCTIKQVK